MKLLVGDIGGTHSRLAIYTGTEFTAVSIHQNDDYPDFYALLNEYYASLLAELRPQRARFAVAAPVAAADVHLTNRNWHLNTARLRQIFDLKQVELMNDFAAVALGIRRLEADGCRQIGEGSSVAQAPLVALGPGTGFGMAGLMPCGDHWTVINSEGGHATLATLDQRELEILAVMRRNHDPVAVEEVLSGPGMFNLYKSIGTLEGTALEAQTPEDVTRLARSGDRLALATLEVFFRLLGRTAGNAALIFNARGGVYLAGGILPALATELEHSGFRNAFLDKGRYRSYLAGIPTFLISDPLIALRGLANLS
jgi:glucokinase